MSFETEKDMYPIIEEWLYLRESNPCLKVRVDSIRFKYGTKVNRPDLVGIFKDDGQYRLVGVEVKNRVTTHQTALRQAQALQAICQEIYVAFPKKQYNTLTSREQNQIQSLLSQNNIGLLLVKKGGSSKVDVVVQGHSSVYSNDLNQKIILEFKKIGENEAEGLLSGLHDYRDFPSLGWEVIEWDGDACFKAEDIFSDESNIEMMVILANDAISITGNIDLGKFSRVLAHHCEMLDYLSEVFANPYNPEKVSFTPLAPMKIIFYDESPEDAEATLSMFGGYYNGPLILHNILIASELTYPAIELRILRERVLDLDDEKYYRKIAKDIAQATKAVFKVLEAIHEEGNL